MGVLVCSVTLTVLHVVFVVEPLCGSPVEGNGAYGDAIKSLRHVAVESDSCFTADRVHTPDQCESPFGTWVIGDGLDHGSQCNIQNGSVLDYEEDIKNVWWKYPPDGDLRFSVTSAIYDWQFAEEMKKQEGRHPKDVVPAFVFQTNTTCGRQVRSIVFAWQSWNTVIHGAALGLYGACSFIGLSFMASVSAIRAIKVLQEVIPPRSPKFLLLVAISGLCAFALQWTALLGMTGCGLSFPTIENDSLFDLLNVAFIVVLIGVAAVCVAIVSIEVLFVPQVIKFFFGESNRFVDVPTKITDPRARTRGLGIAALALVFLFPFFFQARRMREMSTDALNSLVDRHACVLGKSNAVDLEADIDELFKMAARAMYMATLCGIGTGVWSSYPWFKRNNTAPDCWTILLSLFLSTACSVAGVLITWQDVPTVATSVILGLLLVVLLWAFREKCTSASAGNASVVRLDLRNALYTVLVILMGAALGVAWALLTNEPDALWTALSIIIAIAVVAVAVACQEARTIRPGVAPRQGAIAPAPGPGSGPAFPSLQRPGFVQPPPPRAPAARPARRLAPSLPRGGSGRLPRNPFYSSVAGSLSAATAIYHDLPPLALLDANPASHA